MQLQAHLDKDFVGYILGGIKEGFRIGYGGHHELSSASKNMRLAEENSKVVSDYLHVHEEMIRGVILGPFHPPEIYVPGLHMLHINQFRMIPKSGKPGRWRLIVDLLHPG